MPLSKAKNDHENRVILARAELENELELLFVKAQVRADVSGVTVYLQPSQVDKLVRVLRGSSTVV